MKMDYLGENVRGLKWPCTWEEGIFRTGFSVDELVCTETDGNAWFGWRFNWNGRHTQAMSNLCIMSSRDEMSSMMEQLHQNKYNSLINVCVFETCSLLCVIIADTNHTPLTQRVDRALGAMVEPCCMKPPTGNQKLFPSEYWLINRLQRPFRQGWGLYHSYGVNLERERDNRFRQHRESGGI